MIQYALRCADGHEFDSWFQSAAAFDALSGKGLLSCAICGSTHVEKSLMAPRVAASDRSEARPLAEPASPLAKAAAALRKHLTENSDYVGHDFVAQARAMHLGEAPERSIWGEARIEDARALAEDGVPVAPLPLLPARKTN
ncbi:DUF1178 family protein [Roseivivax marinus]|uniref:DUF1178 family protein n=1 Tax=Roseivivax marinus TaxID=1379903 RepID=UPI001F04C28F|nr:DUF1178 family protein [Roseivivax marinus]UMA65441.1 DUF1178 family protein [Roseivivax marinus]